MLKSLGGDVVTKIKIIAAALCLGLGIGLLPLSVSALGNTLFVGSRSVGNDTSCTSPGYNSVQDAVNAARPGQTVYLCGQFAEQVFVNKSITLSGGAGSGLTATGATFSTGLANYPAVFTTDGLATPQALIVIDQPNVNVTVNNLTLSGPMPSNGCTNEDYGLLALAGNVNMNHDSVLNIDDSSSALYGCQFGVGIEIGSYQWPTTDYSAFPTVNLAAKANINDVSVSGYQKNGITVDSTNSYATITNTTVTGGGPNAPFGTIIAQNGIQISNGARAVITGSNVSDNAYSASGYASATGILVYGGYGDPISSNVLIEGNTLSNNDVGVFLGNYNADASGASTTPTNELIIGNRISDNAVTNISGQCDGSASCGGVLIGYQAGITDVGNGDSIFNNDISGKGYAPQGEYNYKTNIFTKNGPNSALVRPIDAGVSFPTINAKVFNNRFDNQPYNDFNSSIFFGRLNHFFFQKHF